MQDHLGIATRRTSPPLKFALPVPLRSLVPFQLPLSSSILCLCLLPARSVLCGTHVLIPFLCEGFTVLGMTVVG